MATRLTETRLRQIIREEASRLAEMGMNDPMVPGPQAVAAAPKWQATVNKIAAYNDPSDEGWIDAIPETLITRLAGQLGGASATNQGSIQRAMVAAGIDAEIARQIIDSAYYTRY
jgi:hypothetical protein